MSVANLPPVIVWFREDLRLSDNPALNAAVETGQPLILLYIFDEKSPEVRRLGGASKWWLHGSLEALQTDCDQLGGSLILRKGSAGGALRTIIDETQASAVFWNRRYDKPGVAIDSDLKSDLIGHGIRVSSFNGRLLTEPWEVETVNRQPYRVFSPYWRALQSGFRAPAPLPRPQCLQGPFLASDALADWNLRPTSPNWARGFQSRWTPGETGALARLCEFVQDGLNGYHSRRDLPGTESTSKLSPHLRFGEISAHQVWRTISSVQDTNTVAEQNAKKFLSELAWREFAHVLLFYQPDLPTRNYKQEFDAMPWSDDETTFKLWCKGQTGYPIVDAGMRELWTTGWMHNRVRMIAASFLTKHLLLPWQRGEQWFWDTLVDADAANNAAGWQWVAGSGADAAPYFRVFNPITQGRKFDTDGNYVRQWCPELSGLPNRYIHAPWEADQDTLANADVELGTSYPTPIVDHATARQRALAAYQSLKQTKELA